MGYNRRIALTIVTKREPIMAKTDAGRAEQKIRASKPSKAAGPSPKPSKSGAVRARVDPDLKRRAEAVLGQVGLTPSMAIRLFYRHIELSGGLPFEVRVPNAQTRAAIVEARSGAGLRRFNGVDELFDDLEG